MTRAAAIIPYNNGIILIQRIKGNKENLQEYYVIPGGGQEEGETIEQATLREVKEELGIEIELTQKYYEIIEKITLISYKYLNMVVL